MGLRPGIVVLLVMALLALPAFAAEKTPDGEGFLRNWLILAPISMAEGQSGEDALNKQWIAGEAKLAPKDGEKVKVGDRELTWKAHEAGDFYFDFNGMLGNVTENAVAYAVVYVTPVEEMKGLQLRIGSDDHCKVYLNGKELIKVLENRNVEKDENEARDVTLNKGMNILVFKVVNGEQDWAGCARFADKNGSPVTNLTVSLVPPAGRGN